MFYEQDDKKFEEKEIKKKISIQLINKATQSSIDKIKKFNQNAVRTGIMIGILGHKPTTS